jgi:tetratricopeptide (TPR) repeat protein
MAYQSRLLPHRSLPRRIAIALSVLALSGFSIAAWAQDAACPAVAPAELTSADEAYAAGRFTQAEDQYGQALARQPHDLKLSANLVKVWLREGEVSQASAQVDKMLPENPASAITLVALAEVQLQRGLPWLALDTLKAATTIDPCYARIFLIRSRVLRIDSMYASQRAQIQKAYDIDPTDPDIRHAFLSTVSPAHEVEAIQQSLTTMHDLDADTRGQAEASIRSMMPLLSENNQTCKILPDAASASFSLQPSYQDAKRIDGYRLTVEFAKTKASLQVDTAASGLFISQALAEANGFEAAAGDPPGTVHVDHVKIGPLEFQDCIVGVKDTPFPGKADGFISTDMFASYLVTLNYPDGKLMLDPLPKREDVLPGDRVVFPSLSGYSPVYHQQQYLLIPVLLNNKSRRLFILDSGIRYSTMTSEAAHSVSTTKINFTNTVQTVSGSTLKTYRDSFDFQLANLSLTHQGHVIELDPSSMSQNGAMQAAGMLGFDLLHSFTLHLDYRDGLVKLESNEAEKIPGKPGASTMAAELSAACETDDRDRPTSSVIEAKVTGLLDSAHLKVGKQLTVRAVNEWRYPACSLPAGAILYGHVTASAPATATNPAELAIAFDQAECDGRAKRPVLLTVIGVIAPPDQFIGLHNAVPVEVSGGGRSTAAAAASLGSSGLDENLNPGGPPKTIHPGIVLSIPAMKLEPVGGPGCSAKMTDTEHSVRLGTGSELILTMQTAK